MNEFGKVQNTFDSVYSIAWLLPYLWSLWGYAWR